MVPFIFPFHEYPADYQRYTASGLRQIAAGFEEVELCILTGPTSALLVFIREYLRLLVPGGNSRITRTLLNGVSGWLVFPLKYLDRFLTASRKLSIWPPRFTTWDGSPLAERPTMVNQFDSLTMNRLNLDDMITEG